MTASEETLVLRRTYDASRERVFHAWTDAKQMESWYTPDIENPTVIEYMDLRAGGGYRVAFGAAEGEVPYVETSSYLEVSPPSKLVFETRLTRGHEVLAETHNILEFIERGAQTEVVMTETGYPLEVKEDRREGWGRTMDNLYAALG